MLSIPETTLGNNTQRLLRLAGNFGYEKSIYGLSMQIGAGIISAVRNADAVTIIAAPVPAAIK